MPDGICPFATQIAGRENLVGYEHGYVDRVGFCDHTASGYYSTLTRYTFWNDPNSDGNASDAVSVHFAISRAGDILQVLNIFDTAYAQGRLGPTVSWPPYNQMGRHNPNGYLISTEHEDYANGSFVAGSQWTEAQYEADLRVKRWCVDEVLRVTGKDLLRFGIDSLAGHHMFDSVNRAECPGRFWRDEYRQRLFNDLTSREEMFQRFNNGYKDVQLPGNQQIYTMNLRTEFAVPDTAKQVELQVFPDNGRVAVYDGTPDVYHRDAGRVFAPHGRVVVIPGEDGSIFIVSEGASTARVFPVAIWV